MLCVHSDYEFSWCLRWLLLLVRMKWKVKAKPLSLSIKNKKDGRNFCFDIFMSVLIWVAFSALDVVLQDFILKHCLQISGLRMRILSWNRFPIERKFANSFDFAVIVKTNYSTWTQLWASFNYPHVVKTQPCRLIPKKHVANPEISNIYHYFSNSIHYHNQHVKTLLRSWKGNGLSVVKITQGPQRSRSKIVPLEAITGHNARTEYTREWMKISSDSEDSNQFVEFKRRYFSAWTFWEKCKFLIFWRRRFGNFPKNSKNSFHASLLAFSKRHFLLDYVWGT